MSDKPSLKDFAVARRKPVSLTKEGLIREGFPDVERPLHLMIEPAVDGLDLAQWAEGNLPFIEKNLLEHGALLFRNFDLNGLNDFERFVQTSSGALLEYSYSSTPRTRVQGNIYTSTEYPAEQSIPLHNEMSYSRSWPMKIFFHCLKAAEQGGETPIADSRRVFELLDTAIKRRFESMRVRYVRNYGDYLDLPWQSVFNTTDKSRVESYCRSAGIEFDWKDGDRLKTWQVCQAVASHPKTGDMVWFNQAHLFHVSSLEPELRESLLSYCEDDELPRNAYYGDGSPIESSVLDEIRQVYSNLSSVTPWHNGDLLLLDNMLVAHGRRPFKGPRRIVVAMTESLTAQ